MPFYRGAPFDKDNLFFVPAIDGGLIKKSKAQKKFLKGKEGGSFSGPPIAYFDGGKIPLAGTATYDPNETYDENSPLKEFNNG